MIDKPTWDSSLQEIAHEPQGTDCLTARAWKGTGDGEVEMDCGCFVPLPPNDLPEYADDEYNGRIPR